MILTGESLNNSNNNNNNNTKTPKDETNLLHRKYSKNSQKNAKEYRCQKSDA